MLIVIKLVLELFKDHKSLTMKIPHEKTYPSLFSNSDI